VSASAREGKGGEIGELNLRGGKKKKGPLSSEEEGPLVAGYLGGFGRAPEKKERELRSGAGRRSPVNQWPSRDHPEKKRKGGDVPRFPREKKRPGKLGGSKEKGAPGRCLANLITSSSTKKKKGGT